MTIFYILKIFIILVVALLPVSILIRDWKYNDKRTLQHHKYTRAIIMIWIVFGFINVIVVPIIDDEIFKRELNELKPQIKIDIQEATNQLTITFESSKLSNPVIDDLFFKFDIS